MMIFKPNVNVADAEKKQIEAADAARDASSKKWRDLSSAAIVTSVIGAFTAVDLKRARNSLITFHNADKEKLADAVWKYAATMGSSVKHEKVKDWVDTGKKFTGFLFKGIDKPQFKTYGHSLKKLYDSLLVEKKPPEPLRAVQVKDIIESTSTDLVKYVAPKTESYGRTFSFNGVGTRFKDFMKDNPNEAQMVKVLAFVTASTAIGATIGYTNRRRKRQAEVGRIYMDAVETGDKVFNNLEKQGAALTQVDRLNYRRMAEAKSQLIR
jgi:hypothetical protein